MNSGKSALTQKESGGALLLEIYSKENCPLCDKAEHAINETLRKLDSIPVKVVKHDIEQDAALYETYRWLIPVVHLNGKQAALYRVNKRALRKRIVRAWKKRHERENDGSV